MRSISNQLICNIDGTIVDMDDARARLNKGKSINNY